MLLAGTGRQALPPDVTPVTGRALDAGDFSGSYGTSSRKRLAGTRVAK
jgi:hypothetical protein